MLFATHLAQCHKLLSIKLYLSAVHMLHLEHGLPEPTAEVINLRCLIRGTHGSMASPLTLVFLSLLPSYEHSAQFSSLPTLIT